MTDPVFQSMGAPSSVSSASQQSYPTNSKLGSSASLDLEPLGLSPGPISALLDGYMPCSANSSGSSNTDTSVSGKLRNALMDGDGEEFGAMGGIGRMPLLPADDQGLYLYFYLLYTINSVV